MVSAPEPHLYKRPGLTHFFAWQVFFLSLAAQAAETLIHSIVTSKVDYCNSLIYCASNLELIQNLLRVRKSAARPLTYTNKLEHIKPLLKQLYWLPVEFRIQYKILLMTFKCLNDAAPAYLILLNVEMTLRLLILKT